MPKLNRPDLNSFWWRWINILNIIYFHSIIFSHVWCDGKTIWIYYYKIKYDKVDEKGNVWTFDYDEIYKNV